jgi:hypothetical protein
VQLNPAGSGKLVVNTKQQTFVFNGKGCTPSAMYTLSYTSAGGTAVNLGTAVADSDGALHITGACTATPTELATVTGFAFQATLDVHPVNNPSWPDWWMFDISASWSGAPSTVTSVYVEIAHSGGFSTWTHTETPLTSPLAVGSLGFYKPDFPTPPTLVCILTVTDSAGHTATAEQTV